LSPTPILGSFSFLSFLFPLFPIELTYSLVVSSECRHGGITAVMKLTKLFVEAGAAGE